jgi:hypothetical protein
VEVAAVAGDPLDQRVDLEECPALARPTVAGDRADAEADRADRLRRMVRECFEDLAERALAMEIGERLPAQPAGSCLMV